MSQRSVFVFFTKSKFVLVSVFWADMVRVVILFCICLREDIGEPADGLRQGEHRSPMGVDLD